MAKQTVLVENSTIETKQILKELISKTFGQILNENSRHISWTIGVKPKVIGFETEIITKGKLTEIATSFNTDDFWELEAEQTLSNLYKKLKQNPKITIPKESKTKTKKKKQNNNINLWGLISTVVIIISILAMALMPENNKLNPTTKTYITKIGYYGTIGYNDLKYVMELASQGDEEALDELYQKGFYAEVPAGVEVYIQEFKSGAVRIRAKGTNLELWTVKEAIKD